MRVPRLALTIVALGILAACDDGPPTPSSVEVVAGASQNGIAGQSLAVTPSFVVQDRRGRTMSGVPVEIRVPKESGARSSVQEARESAERDHILRALEETNWNVSGAARALGMDRTNLHKRIRTLGLTRER